MKLLKVSKKTFKASITYFANLAVALSLVIFTSVIINISNNRKIETKLVEKWLAKGAECMEEPRTWVDQFDKKFYFECPVKEETPQEKAYREVPSDYFNFDRRGDKEYILKYISDNFPQYDCPLIDKYWKEGEPCWELSDQLIFNPQTFLK